MADEKQEINMSEKRCLFPIVSSNSYEKSSPTQSRSFFPSVSVPVTQQKESLDWLSNASYKIQAEIPSNVQEREHESASSISSDEEEEILKKEKAKQTEDKHHRKRRKNERSKKHKKHKHKKHKKSVDDAILTKLPSTIWIEESGLEIEKAFRIHRKPDYDNCAFGGLYRLDIALHSLNPELKCLGLTEEKQIGRKPKGKDKKKTSERYWENSVSSDEVFTFEPNSSKNTGFGFSKNFSYVPLELPSAAKDDDIGSSSISIEKPSSELVLKTRELNQKVRENPNDIQSWLALADLQEHQVESSNQTTNSLNKDAFKKQKKSTKMAMEKKVAVLEQAIEKNASCVALIVGYMNACIETMSSEAIVEKWRKFLFIQPQKTLLWKHYLMFCQSNFSTFSFSTTLAVYTKCFTTLSAIQSGKFTSHSAETDIESGMVEIFLQLCQFLKQSGQTEKAIAAFLALIEFNCFCPKQFEEEHSPTSFFETFWDSELPRFGEEDAAGWSNWMGDQPKKSHCVPLSEIFSSSKNTSDKSLTEEEIISDHSDKPTTWEKLETLREIEQWFPKKTTDDEDDDPDRVVLFQDISFALFKTSHEKLKFQLLCYFLSFLGVPIANYAFSFESERILSLLLDDEEQLNSFVNAGHNASSPCCFHGGISERTHKTPSAFYCRFVRNIFNQSLECFSEHFQALLAIHWLNFEKNILMSESNPKQRKQCYKAARKLAKSLLKLEQHRNNLRLWFAFIEIEWINGNLEEARRVVSSLLEQLQNDIDETSTMRYYHFVRLYCELEMGLKDGDEPSKKVANLQNLKNKILSVISVLVNKACGSVQAILTPAQILKTQKLLQDKSAQVVLDFHSWKFGPVEDARKEFLVDFMTCYALFQYWSLGINAARSVLDSLLSAVNSEKAQDESSRVADHQDVLVKFFGSKNHEAVMVFYCELLQFHSLNNICPVKPLRELLLSSLAMFPESAFFLHSYVMLESRSRTSYSIRRYFDSVLGRSITPLPWLYAVLYERQKQKVYQSTSQIFLEPASRQGDVSESSFSSSVQTLPQTGVVHRLRSLYERMIHHSSTRHNVAVWRSYIKFEAENGDLHQAKAIFYQSLQSCAWAKTIYLDAIKMFQESFQDVYDMMEDKELRIRTPLDELNLLLET